MNVKFDLFGHVTAKVSTHKNEHDMNERKPNKPLMQAVYESELIYYW